jgi:hypothetical protein
MGSQLGLYLKKGEAMSMKKILIPLFAFIFLFSLTTESPRPLPNISS